MDSAVLHFSRNADHCIPTPPPVACGVADGPLVNGDPSVPGAADTGSVPVCVIRARHGATAVSRAGRARGTGV